jgi:hypothetical protein
MANIEPNARIELIDALVRKLYRSSTLYGNKTINKLIQDNSELHGNNQQMFSFRKTVFTTSDFTGAFPSPINTLSPTIREDVKEYLSFTEETNAEKCVVKGFLQRVVTSSHCAADYAKLTPTQLHSVIKQFSYGCEQGEGTLTEPEIAQFKHDNAKYLELVKTRLTMNLINAP